MDAVGRGTGTADAPWPEAVGGAGSEALVSLLRRRPDLSARRPDSLDALAAAVVDPRSVAAFYHQCDQTTRDVLEALCVVGQPATVARLEAVLGTGPGTLDSPLDDLAEAFLVRLVAGGGLLVNPGLAGAVGRPARLGPALRRVLLNQSMDLLRDVATRIGLSPAKTTGATADRIVECFSDPTAVGRLVDAGPEGTRHLAERVATAGPEVDLGTEAYVLGRTDATPAGYLLRRGLLLSTSWRRAVMPAEVAVALRGGRLFPGFRLDPPPVELVTFPGSADGPAAEAAQQVVADVASILELWGAAPPKLLQAGGVGVRELRRTAKAVARPEVEVARLVELAAAADLVRPELDEGVALPTVGYDRWRAMPSSERWAVLAEAWWAAPVHLSLVGSPDEAGKPLAPLVDRPVEASAIARRRAVVALLAALPADTAADARSLVERVSWSRPAIWTGGPAEPATLVGWVLDEAALLGVASGGRLASFGRALAADGGAAELLAGHLPPLVSDLVLQADLTALVAGEVHPDLRAELELLADLESAGAASLWRFSPRSLERAFDAGRSDEQILAFLAARARKGVPQPLAYLVADLARRFGQLRVGTASCYVRSDDPTLLAELVRARRVGALRLRLLAPTVAASDADPSRVVATLRDAGYLAAAEDADGTLVVTRPSARRARGRLAAGPGGDPYDDDPYGPYDDAYDDDAYEDDDGDLDDVAAALVDEPELVAALTGLPVELLRSLGSARGHTDGLPVPEDPDELVHRLLAAPRPAAPKPTAPKPAAGRPAGTAPPSPFEDLVVRPNGIGRDVDEVAALAEQAFDQDWIVRLSHADGRGDERELDALVVGLDERSLTVRSLPGGDLLELARSRIRWVRILTEAEEEART